MIKVKYLRHPVRTLNAASTLVKARLAILSSAADGRSRYKKDPRYDLQNVTSGFASRLDFSADDSELILRICDAYIKSVQHSQVASEVYKATAWWSEIRSRSLQPVIQALMSRDIGALRRMYQNFFRDSCSTGLVSVPYGMSKAYFGKKIKDINRHFYLSDSLRRLDYWSSMTQGRFNICALSDSKIGNPFGICLNDTFIRSGAPYQHYCSHRVSSVIGSNKHVVAEIGGGFGGMAYYLLRDRNVTYIDFDVPESIALISYYLLKAFPHLQVRLFGEASCAHPMTDRADVYLMPLSELPSMPTESVDIVFSSHAMSDLSRKALQSYLHTIERITRDSFLYIGNISTADVINETILRDYPLAKPVQTSHSRWNDHTGLSEFANEVECLYRFKTGSNK
jgi:putative sugar O-methyltransferase